jgi:hypothetical protein
MRIGEQQREATHDGTGLTLRPLELLTQAAQVSGTAALVEVMEDHLGVQVRVLALAAHLGQVRQEGAQTVGIGSCSLCEILVQDAIENSEEG